MSDGSAGDPKDELFDVSSSFTIPTDEESDQTKGIRLPIARVKKIMKEGEHPGMISADAPVILAKACEMLIKELTLKSWDCTLLTRRCTLQKQDVTSAIFKNSSYNFLIDILTPEELKPRMESSIVGTRIMLDVGNGYKYNQIPKVGMKNELLPPMQYYRDVPKRILHQIHPYHGYNKHPPQSIGNLPSSRYLYNQVDNVNTSAPANANNQLLANGSNQLVGNRRGGNIPLSMGIAGSSIQSSASTSSNSSSNSKLPVPQFTRNNQQYANTQMNNNTQHIYQSQPLFNNPRFNGQSDTSNTGVYSNHFRPQ